MVDSSLLRSRSGAPAARGGPTSLGRGSQAAAQETGLTPDNLNLCRNWEFESQRVRIPEGKLILVWVTTRFELAKIQVHLLNPSTPKSDQVKIFPAASLAILYIKKYEDFHSLHRWKTIMYYKILIAKLYITIRETIIMYQSARVGVLAKPTHATVHDKQLLGHFIQQYVIFGYFYSLYFVLLKQLVRKLHMWKYPANLCTFNCSLRPKSHAILHMSLTQLIEFGLCEVLPFAS